MLFVLLQTVGVLNRHDLHSRHSCVHEEPSNEASLLKIPVEQLFTPLLISLLLCLHGLRRVTSSYQTFKSGERGTNLND